MVRAKVIVMRGVGYGRSVVTYGPLPVILTGRWTKFDYQPSRHFSSEEGRLTTRAVVVFEVEKI